MKYFTSDLHAFHKNISKFTDRKLVTSVEDHESWLTNIWNSKVTNSDLVYILGDLSFGKYNETVEFLKSLNGQKIVIKGNHDNERHLSRLVSEKIILTWKLYDEIDIQGTKACLMHFPIASWHKQHYGSYMLFGHSHGMFQGQGKTLDVGIDSAYKIFGKHKLFSEDIVSFMQHKEIYIADSHRKEI
jgi:calcineurin-like phosphoesterase family protein